MNYSWLPDHHVSVAATLAHADEVIAELANILFEFQTQPEGIIRLTGVPVVTYSETVVMGLAPIPKKVPLLVADALVALRNAIEHTLFAEIEHRDGVLGEKAAKLVEMPATESYKDFVDWVKRRAKNGPTAMQQGSELLKRIEALQPYHRTKDPQNHPMALLALHTNFTKHRAPAVTAVGLGAILREDRTPPSRADLDRRTEQPLKAGDVIARTPRGVRVPVSLFPKIGINRPGTDRWPVLMNELADLADWVRRQAVPRLVTGNDPPLPTLPARYEISVGHEDERIALTKGSDRSAAERHRARLAAGTARRDMLETLSMMEYAPTREQIETWLAGQDDEALIARMQQIRPTPNYEPDIVWKNFEVLESMRDDARRFAGLDVETD